MLGLMPVKLPAPAETVVVPEDADLFHFRRAEFSKLVHESLHL
jgi:hypothetical protein